MDLRYVFWRPAGKLLRAAGLDDRAAKGPNAPALFAFQDLMIVGALSFRAGRATEISYIEVHPRFQGMGIGRGLVDAFVGRALQTRTERIDCYLYEEDNDPEGLPLFLWKCGLSPEDDHADLTFPLREALDQPVFRKILRKKDHFSSVHFLEEAKPYGKKRLKQFLQVRTKYRGDLEKDVLAELSTVMLRGQTFLGCVLVGEEDGILTLEYAYVSPDTGDKTVLAKLLIQALSKAARLYGPEKQVRILATGTSSERILQKMFPEESRSQRLYRYSLSLARPGLPEIPEDYPPIGALPEGGDDSTLAYEPTFTPVECGSLLCRDCVYRLPSAGECHRYLQKPEQVFSGQGCTFHHSQRRI